MNTKLPSGTTASWGTFDELIKIWEHRCFDLTPVDHARIERAVADMYALARLPAPTQFIWCASPLVMYEAAHANDERGAGLKSTLEKAGQMGYAIARWENLYDRGVQNTLNNLWTRVWNGVSEKVRERLGSVLRDDTDFLPDNLICAVYDVGDLMAVDLVDGPEGPDDPDVRTWLHASRALCEINWWSPYANVTYLCERPVETRFDELGHLHEPFGPALRYGDGFSVFSYEDDSVEPALVMHPESVTYDHPWVRTTTDRLLWVARRDPARLLLAKVMLPSWTLSLRELDETLTALLP